MRRPSPMAVTASVQCAAQGMLWVVFSGYDLSAQAVWQAALSTALPVAGLWFLWKNVPQKWGWTLFPCLMADAVSLLYALCALMDGLMPEYPYWLGAVVPAAVCWGTVMVSRRDGVACGVHALRWGLLLLFLLGTVFLRASTRADRLWPLDGNGVAHTLRAAAGGAGAMWGAALCASLPGERRHGAGLLAAFAAVCVWALWHGFLRPWTPGAQVGLFHRLLGLARHAQSIVSYELAGLMWLVLLPMCLTACAMSGEVLLPSLPRGLCSAAVLVPAAAAVCFAAPHLPDALRLISPARTLWCVAAGLYGRWRK